MDITLSFLAKSLDKHGVTLVHITYPSLHLKPLKTISDGDKLFQHIT